MAPSTGRPDWVQFARPGFALRFRYPTVTPQGRPVDCVADDRDGVGRAHLTARESAELYVEVVRFRHLAPEDEYARPARPWRNGSGPKRPAR